MNLALYRDLFIIRDDVYAEQARDGNYFTVREPLTDDELAEHFAGLATYGTYTTMPETNTVKWLCFDLDTEDPEARTHLTESVHELLNKLGEANNTVIDLRCLLLEDSNGQGRTHVWLFFDKPIMAVRVRAWVAAQFMPMWMTEDMVSRGMDSDWPLEVFPKQDTVPQGAFGNLVRMPFGKNRKTGLFSTPVVLQGWASSVEEVRKLDTGLVPKLAPGGPKRERVGGVITPTPFPCIDACKAGVGEGQRDQAMYRLAVYYRTHGIDQDVALEQMLLDNANFDPPLDERQVRRKCESAYDRRQVPLGCDEFLRGICPGGEDCKSGARPSGRTAVGRGGLRYEDMDQEQRREHRRRLREGQRG